jgi:hypothetical protein
MLKKVDEVFNGIAMNFDEPLVSRALRVSSVWESLTVFHGLWPIFFDRIRGAVMFQQMLGQFVDRSHAASLGHAVR